ncbi:MAG TPA: hypothetical protein VFA54_16130 [Bryobacterales bacterium]|jgi:hypothetical protein|nr:hypothetical protein [Bryobacterales bacterium]
MKSRWRAAALILMMLALIVAFRVFGPRDVPEGQPALVSITDQTFSDFQRVFNDSAETTRILVLFSPSEKRSLQGASALQATLEDFPKARLRVLVVWEPVERTDFFAPTSDVLARISDRRAVQFWDRNRLVSQRIKAAGIPSVLRGNTIWDFLALFPPGARWDSAMPTPVLRGAPVVNVMEGLSRYLYSNSDPAASP